MENPSRRRVLTAGLAGTTLASPAWRPRPRDHRRPRPAGRGPRTPTRSCSPSPRSSSSPPATCTRRRSTPVPATSRCPGDDARQPRGATPTGSPGSSAVPRRRRADEALVRRVRGRLRDVATSTRSPPPATTSSRRAVATLHRGCSVSSRASTAPALAASILIVEARHCAVLADLGGQGDDLDACSSTTPSPLPRRRSDADELRRPTTDCAIEPPPPAADRRPHGLARRRPRRVRRRRRDRERARPRRLRPAGDAAADRAR